MRSKGIVQARRQGLHVLYSLTSPKVVQACELMREVLAEQISRKQEILLR